VKQQGRGGDESPRPGFMVAFFLQGRSRKPFYRGCGGRRLPEKVPHRRWMHQRVRPGQIFSATIFGQPFPYTFSRLILEEFNREWSATSRKRG
jgi:hypothetical protein